MARGWESKSIEAQQELTLPRTPGDRSRVAGQLVTEDQLRMRERRRTLELARRRTAEDLARATFPSHRQMLEQALAALDDQMRQLESPEKPRT